MGTGARPTVPLRKWSQGESCIFCFTTELRRDEFSLASSNISKPPSWNYASSFPSLLLGWCLHHLICLAQCHGDHQCQFLGSPSTLLHIRGQMPMTAGVPSRVPRQFIPLQVTKKRVANQRIFENKEVQRSSPASPLQTGQPGPSEATTAVPQESASASPSPLRLLSLCLLKLKLLPRSTVRLTRSQNQARPQEEDQRNWLSILVFWNLLNKFGTWECILFYFYLPFYKFISVSEIHYFRICFSWIFFIFIRHFSCFLRLYIKLWTLNMCDQLYINDNSIKL